MLLLVWNLSIIPHVSGQSNYASHANNIGYRGEGLPEEATLDGKVSIKHFVIYWTIPYHNILKLLSDWNTNRAYFTDSNEFTFKVKVCACSQPGVNDIEYYTREKYIGF